MQISDEPFDLPDLPTADGTTARFGVDLFTFVPQPSLEEWGMNRGTQTRDGGPETLLDASLMYTLWRNPDDRADPVNRGPLTDAELAALDEPTPRPLPAELEAVRQRMRWPSLWEAVKTTVMHPPGAGIFVPDLAGALLQHAEHIIVNSFRDARTGDAFPPVISDAPAADDLDRVRIEVDGVLVDGLRLDRDADVVAVGAQVGDRILTAVVPRAELAHVRLAFVTRPRPA
ncbi:hypothetical protein ACMA46_05350 [Clavibacter sp. Sh2141]|uniref:hypothetical protein n=1 Tax=Clavibacter sp. Sh2141 TaxID=3395374 RepID=UPI0039BCB0E6